MKKAVKFFLSAAVVIFLLTGCSVNQIMHVEQPVYVGSGESFPVYIFDLYIIFSDTNVLQEETLEDSLLISAALPDDWKVNSAKFHVDENFYQTLGPMLSGPTIDSATLVHIADSVLGIMETASATSDFDQGITSNYVEDGRQIVSFLATDSIIYVPEGTMTDTTLPDTINQDRDSIYAKLVGCLIQLDVTAGPIEEEANLGYLVSYRPSLPQSYPISLLTSFADSNIIHVTAPGIEAPSAALSGPFSFNVWPNPLTGSANLTCFLPRSQSPVQGVLKVYDVSGKLRHFQSMNLSRGHNSIDLHRSALQSPSGMYIMELQAGSKRITRRVHIMQ